MFWADVIVWRLQRTNSFSTPGESAIIGPYTFGNVAAEEDLQSNRSMLMEYCTEFSSILANTWSEPGSDGVVTYRNLGIELAAEVRRHQDFAQIDFTIRPVNVSHSLRDIYVDRIAGLRS